MIKQVIKSFNSNDKLLSPKTNAITKRTDSIASLSQSSVSLSNLESESQHSDSNLEQLSNKRTATNDDDYDADDNNDTANPSSKKLKNQLVKLKYGPIQVEQRLKAAPTLATGRRSKDVPLPPEEEKRREERRTRNKKAAAKCRRKREEVAEQLEKRASELTSEHDKLLNEMKKLTEKKEELLKLLKIHDKKCKNSPSKKEASPTKLPSILFQTNILTNKKINENFVDQKIDDDTETDLKKKNPMISGNSIKNPLTELSEYAKFERPKDLGLMMFTRQDSMSHTLLNLCTTPTPTSGVPTSTANFLTASTLNSTNSPTLNTPTAFLTISQMDNFSPTTPTNTSRLFTILKS
jgi:hypothetical protein